VIGLFVKGKKTLRRFQLGERIPPIQLFFIRATCFLSNTTLLLQPNGFVLSTYVTYMIETEVSTVEEDAL